MTLVRPVLLVLLLSSSALHAEEPAERPPPRERTQPERDGGRPIRVPPGAHREYAPAVRPDLQRAPVQPAPLVRPDAQLVRPDAQPVLPGGVAREVVPQPPAAATRQPEPLAPERPQSGFGVPATGERVRITVRTIAATREAASPEIDGRLSPISSDLRSFADQFSYKGYRLVEEHTFELDWDVPAQLELPGSRSIEISPRQLSPDGRIKVHLEVLGSHPEHARRLHADYTIGRGRTLLVGGYHLDPDHPDQGTLLIAITQGVH